MAEQSTQLTEFEQTVVSALDSTLPAQPEKKRKRKQPHGPNPLSVKKKTKKSCTVVVSNKGIRTKNQVCRQWNWACVNINCIHTMYLPVGVSILA